MPPSSKDFPLGAISGLDSGEALKLARLQNQLGQGSALGNANQLKGLKEGKSGVDTEKAAEQFEALLLQQMLQSMWTTVPSNGLLSGSKEEDLYRDMFNEAVAAEFARSQSIGIKDVVVKEMQHKEKK